MIGSLCKTTLASVGNVSPDEGIVTNHSAYKVVNSTRLCSRGPSRLLGNPSRTPPKISSNCKARFFSQHRVAWLFPRICPHFHQLQVRFLSRCGPSLPHKWIALSYLLLPGTAWAFPTCVSALGRYTQCVLIATKHASEKGLLDIFHCRPTNMIL